MIINRLTMHNFGIYAYTNTFEFTGKKPVVLIGGMNGRGKTTFLDAILLALYGANSFAYKESDFHSYNQYLRSFVNIKDGTLKTYVELEFRLNDASKTVYTVRRSWDATKKVRTQETIHVLNNGQEDQFLDQNWPMFIESILPSAISNFFFFDGEKIADLAVDNTNSQLKESIRAMLGITTLDILKSDLKTNIRHIKNKTPFLQKTDEVDKLRSAKEDAEKKQKDAQDSLTGMEAELVDLNKQVENAMAEFTAHGGDALLNRKQMEHAESVLKEKVSQHSSNMVALASGELPLSLVRDLLEEVAAQADQEHEALEKKHAREMISQLYEQYKKEGNKADAADDFIRFVDTQTEETEIKSIYNLSDHDQYLAKTLSEREIKKKVNEAEKECNENKRLLEDLEKVENYLSIDINEEELQKINENIINLQNKVKEKEEQIEGQKAKLSEANGELRMAKSLFDREVKKMIEGMESDDDKSRVIKYSEMAIHVLEEYEIRIQKAKTGELAETITSCYKKLADKKNLIDRVVMNPVTLDWKYLDQDGNEVAKSSLSAGEKQLMVISILWALAIRSKKNLPVIIDTPLSRMDSNHRKSLIEVYFPNASEQTIILSTDSEIDEKYYRLMKENVGDEYTLIYDDENKCTHIEKGYFGYNA